MIDEICVANLALIERAQMAPSAGLTAITGETGAGKTALLESCKLLKGARADKGVIREGSDAASVKARLFLDEVLRLDSAADGITLDGEYVVERTVAADGRSRIRINGEMASVAELADQVGRTITLCGQHDSLELLKRSDHTALLCEWAHDEAEGPREAYRSAWEVREAAAGRLADIRAASASSAEQLEQARFVLRQIEAVSPREGEYEELAAALAKAEHSEALARSASDAACALSGEEGALDRAAAALSALDDAVRFDEGLAGLADTLREASYLLEDVSRDVASYRERIDFAPDELASMQERMAAYQGLLRSFGPEVADVLAARAQAQDRLALADDSERLVACAQAELDAAEEALLQAGRAFADVLATAAPGFAAAVTSVMGRLEMGSAELVCEADALPRERWTASGPVRMEMLFRPARHMQARPLSRIASGGELSRVMLALEVAEQEAGVSAMETLVFDEIDAGVGGATAIALADVLAQLARTRQVIVVTHLPQVAARAEVHYAVQKTETGGVAATELRKLQGGERTREIARMLSGTITEASLKHAEELISA